MLTRAQFAKAIARLELSHTQRAVALLWFYRHSQQYEERSASELASDLHDEGFPKPNVTRLAAELRKSRDTAQGKRPGTFQIDLRRVAILEEEFLPLLGQKQIEVSEAILPKDLVIGTRSYIEQLAHQINGTYDYRFFDACAVLCRRLMESLIIDIYLHLGRQAEIQQDGHFIPLERLLAHIKGNRALALSRGTPKTMEEIKQLGDTAAHDRTYITTQQDIDDVKLRYRKMIADLLALARIRR